MIIVCLFIAILVIGVIFSYKILLDLSNRQQSFLQEMGRVLLLCDLLKDKDDATKKIIDIEINAIMKNGYKE